MNSRSTCCNLQQTKQTIYISMQQSEVFFNLKRSENPMNAMHRNVFSSSRRKLRTTTQRGSPPIKVPCKSSAIRSILISSLVISVTVTILGARYVANNMESSSSKSVSLGASKQSLVRKSPSTSTSSSLRLQDFQKIAMDLVRLLPAETLKQLQEKDPFGTRSFEKQLEEAETAKGRVLTLDEIVQLFPCPLNNRITLPDRRNHTKALAFRNQEPGYFLFFQHLRKAGGTHFCSLAETNLPKEAIPIYYCMPDYHWSRPDGKFMQCAGCLSHWTNEEITRNIGKHRIAGNEWDKFEPERHFELQASFATSFRRPLDRALSQFRFECVENRGCEFTDIGKWWKHRTGLTNVYTWTFSKTRRIPRISFDAQYAQDRAEAVESAIDVISQFNLVLSMEWLAYAGLLLQRILGFHNTSAITQRVRPHITQAKRKDNQENNALGAAGIAKASWIPKDYLTPEQVRFVRR
jgi:hypothetical protein